MASRRTDPSDDDDSVTGEHVLVRVPEERLDWLLAWSWEAARYDPAWVATKRVERRTYVALRYAWEWRRR